MSRRKSEYTTQSLNPPLAEPTVHDPVAAWENAVRERADADELPISGIKATELLKKEQPELYAEYLTAINPPAAAAVAAETMTQEEADAIIAEWEKTVSEYVAKDKRHPVFATAELRKQECVLFSKYLAALSVKKKR